jgi:Polyketide cyclase / dehydrase and lipid transport
MTGQYSPSRLDLGGPGPAGTLTVAPAAPACRLTPVCWRCAMAKIEGEILIGRPVDVVFDYVADQSNELHYNPQMVRAEKITAGPIGKGTRFRSAVAPMGRTAEMLVECTGYDRPRMLASTTAMSQADITYTLTFEPAAAGTRMRWSGQVRPKGAFRLLGPLITWLGVRQERRIWAGLKQHLETAAQPTA